MNFSQDPISPLENLKDKSKTKSISIYLVLVLAILVFIILLPFLQIDIASQGCRMLRGTTDNVSVNSLVNGKVTFIKLKNNQLLQRGEKLIIFTEEWKTYLFVRIKTEVLLFMAGRRIGLKKA